MTIFIGDLNVRGSKITTLILLMFALPGPQSMWAQDQDGFNFSYSYRDKLLYKRDERKNLTGIVIINRMFSISAMYGIAEQINLYLWTGRLLTLYR
jgi:hypothetical protein